MSSHPPVWGYAPPSQQLPQSQPTPSHGTFPPYGIAQHDAIGRLSVHINYVHRPNDSDDDYKSSTNGYTVTVEDGSKLARPFTPLPRTLSPWDWLPWLLLTLLASAIAFVTISFVKDGVRDADIISNPPEPWCTQRATQGFLLGGRWLVVLPTVPLLIIVVPWLFANAVQARLRLELHSRLRNASAPTTGILQCLWRVATKSVSTSSESLSHKAPGDFRKLESPFFTLRRLESMTYYVISGFFSLLISSFLMVEADGLTSASTDASILFQTSGFDASTCLQGNWADRAVQRGLANLRAEKEKDDNRKYVPLVYALKEADAGLDHPFVVAGFGDGLSVWSDATAEETATYGETGWWVACSETECYAYHAPNGTDMTTVNRNAVNVTAVREAFFQLAVIDPVLLALSRAGSLEQDEKVLGKTNGTAASSSGARKPGITWGIVTGLTNDQSSNTYRTGFLVSRACSVQRSTIAKQMPSKAQGLSRVFTFRSYTPSKVTVLLPGKVIWYPAFAPWIIIAFTVSCGVVAVLPHLMVGVLGSGREDDDEKKWKSVVALTQDGAVGLLAGGRLDVTTTAEGKLVVTD